MKLKYIGLFTGLILFSQNILAVNLAYEERKPSFWELETANMLAPYTTPALWVMIPGTLTTYALYKNKKDKGEIGFNPNYDKRDKDWRKIGNILGWGLLQAGYLALQYPAIKRGSKEALNNSEIMIKSTLYTSLTTFLMKMLISEQRQDDAGKFDSFPSGHASAAFAFATNVAINHEWYWNFISIPLALLASGSRVDDDSHYLHDAVFGATLGISYAIGINYLYKKKKRGYLLGFEPTDGGAKVTWNIRW